MAIQGDGKIVAVGYGGTQRDFVLARYNPNGSLDSSFSGDGKQTTDFGGTDVARGVALQGDGKIVVVGRAGGVDFSVRARPLQPRRVARHELHRAETPTSGRATTRRRRWRSKATARSS